MNTDNEQTQPDEAFFDDLRAGQQERNEAAKPRDVDEVFGREDANPFTRDRRQQERMAQPNPDINDRFNR